MEMRSFNIPSKPSKHVLGKMYRKVHLDDYFINQTEDEYKYSMICNYRLSDLILDRHIFNALPYLCDAFEKIVAPFESFILEKMRECETSSEGLFFCKDSYYKYIGVNNVRKLTNSKTEKVIEAHKQINKSV